LNILDLSYHNERKGLDHLFEVCIVAPINQQPGIQEGGQGECGKQRGKLGAGGRGVRVYFLKKNEGLLMQPF
jgi:hypothetical protein